VGDHPRDPVSFGQQRAGVRVDLDISAREKQMKTTQKRNERDRLESAQSWANRLCAKGFGGYLLGLATRSNMVCFSASA
jgi:hypothetical protein